MMDIVYKTYEQGEDTLLAACDKELLGQKFKEGEICLKVKTSFYQGEETDEKGLTKLLENCTIANLVGERTIEVAVDTEFGRDTDIMMVEGVPHLQIVRLFI